VAEPEETVERLPEASRQAFTAERPTFTPYTVAPRILNVDEVQRAMVREYPALLRDGGIGGTVRVYFFIDENGQVGDTRIDQSSGHAALDEVALSVAGVFRFSPALNRDRPTPVWVSFPITFQVAR
jgi:protein TonB